MDLAVAFHAGILVLEARDMNHAVQLIGRHPALTYGNIFEIRPAADMSEIEGERAATGKGDCTLMLAKQMPKLILSYSRALFAPEEQYVYSQNPLHEYLAPLGAKCSHDPDCAPTGCVHF